MTGCLETAVPAIEKGIAAEAMKSGGQQGGVGVAGKSIEGGAEASQQWLERIHGPQAIEEYSDEIFQRLFQLEEQEMAGRGQPDSRMVERHPDTEVKEKMRAILAKFKLMSETLYLTVDLLDRYLAKVPVRRAKLQQVSRPTIYHFLSYYAYLAYPCPQEAWPLEQAKAFNLACYTLEMCLLDSRTQNKHPPSKLAAAALFMYSSFLSEGFKST
eukprot:g11319.t1